MKNMKPYKTLIFSIILIFCILWIPFFTKSGTYFFLDTVFFPIYELKGFFSQSLYWHFLDILSFTFGYKLYSKIFFILVLATGAFLGYKIGKFVADFFGIKDTNTLFFLQASSITFTLSAPFIYERLVSQTGIALGVFCIGIGFIYLLEFLLLQRRGSFKKDSERDSERSKGILLSASSEGQKGISKGQKNNKNLYLSSLFFAISLTIFPHSVVFIFLIAIFSLIFFFHSFSLKNISIAFVIFLAINLNWILGTFVFDSVEYGVKNTVATLNQQNIEVFKGNSLSGLGVEITHFFGYGFWGEKFGHLVGTDLVNKYFWIFGIIVYLLIVIGVYHFWKKEKKITLYLLILTFVSYILALGISSPITAPLNQFLYDTIPYYIGMREPGKLLGLMTLIFILFFSFGAYKFGLSLKKIYFDITDNFNLYSYLVLIVALLNAFNPNMLFSFKGQLDIIKYPQEYFDSKTFLEKNNYTKNVVFPWHSYMACEWKKGGVFSNTYPNILNFPETIKADNIEMENLYTNYDNPISKEVERFLKEKNVEILKSLGIQTITFQDKCADSQNYEYLETLDGVQKIFDKKYLKIYKIQ